MSLPDPLEPRLIDALQPVRQYVLATALHHLFESGLFDWLAGRDGGAEAELCAALDFIPERLRALLQYLANEGVVSRSDDQVRLTDRGRSFAEFRGWYTMLIGGYGATFLQLGGLLKRGAPPATRVADKVGIGSCMISHHDAIPLTRRLMASIARPVRRLLDLGCGNALYLVEFCKALPELEAWGVEPDRKGYEAASELVEREGLAHRIHLTCSSAQAFYDTERAFSPDVTVLGFVLHEILGQDGEAGVLRFLHQLTRRYPALHLIVIEVDQQLENPAAMRHGLALAYYNPYYLFHPFTQQRLETCGFWERLFAEAGLEILDRATVDRNVDSTGLEVGYLLRRSRSARESQS